MPTSSKPKRLADAYRFPGFRPLSKLRGVFGDRKARVVTLVRRSKKRFAVRAGRGIADGTTGRCGERGICPTATRASISNSRCGESLADVVAK